MSGDWSWIEVATPQVSPSMPNRESVYPMSVMVRHDRVEHRVGDLVGEFVGMSLGHGLRGEQVTTGHVRRIIDGSSSPTPLVVGSTVRPVPSGHGTGAPAPDARWSATRPRG